MKSIRKILHAWFSLSTSERNGTIILTVLLLLLLIIWMFLPKLLKNESTDHQEALSEATMLQMQFAEAVTTDSSDYTEEPVLFDPNIATADQLRLAGMKEKTIRTLLNFRLKGGIFRSAEDLKKIYGLSQKEFAVLAPRIVISNEERRLKTPGYTDTTKNSAVLHTYASRSGNPSPVLELNGADSISLEKLPGIGPVLASRIVRYRQKLGGFYTIAQLKEVYGITPELAEKLASGFTLDTGRIRKIDLNAHPGESDLKHPYLTSWQVKGILKYMEQGKRMQSSMELVHYKILKPEEWERIQHYLLP